MLIWPKYSLFTPNLFSVPLQKPVYQHVFGVKNVNPCFLNLLFFICLSPSSHISAVFTVSMSILSSMMIILITSSSLSTARTLPSDAVYLISAPQGIALRWSSCLFNKDNVSLHCNSSPSLLLHSFLPSL